MRLSRVLWVVLLSVTASASAAELGSAEIERRLSRPVSIEVKKKASLASALTMLSLMCDVPLTINPDIKKDYIKRHVTLAVKDTPGTTALLQLLSQVGLTPEIRNDCVWIDRPQGALNPLELVPLTPPEPDEKEKKDKKKDDERENR